MVVLNQHETVVILHGIGHTRWNMYGVERAMRRAGYDVVNITYPSRRHRLDTLAGFVHDRLNRERIWNIAGKVHFVTHSMGGLVIRVYLEKYKNDIPADKAGRFVMLAPPNGGSEIADFLCDFPPYRWIFGPAGQELSTQMRPGSALLCETGIIAGTKGWCYPIANLIIPGGAKAHDGRVAVERTKLDHMKDHITLPATHGLIAWRGDTHKQVVHFLQHGIFRHEAGR